MLCMEDSVCIPSPSPNCVGVGGVGRTGVGRTEVGAVAAGPDWGTTSGPGAICTCPSLAGLPTGTGSLSLTPSGILSVTFL